MSVTHLTVRVLDADITLLTEGCILSNRTLQTWPS